MKLILFSVFLTLTNFFQASLANLINKDFQKKLMTKLITAKNNTTITIEPGIYYLDGQLSLVNKKGITIRGAGIDKTVLNFKYQKIGAEGIYVKANDFIIEDLTIQDTASDGIKVNQSRNITIRRVKVEWTQGPHITNGGYGLYPVLCENVLIEDTIAIGSSDSGIYVGQSKNIIVRNNKAYYNVAGLEIENSIHADVYNNELMYNSGGILVFNMPDLSQDGEHTRVFNNTVVSNNTVNFSPPKNTVADLPAGTGIMVTANKRVEIFNNIIKNHGTSNILLVSYDITGRPYKDTDPDYDPYAESIYIYDNHMENSGFNPQGGASEPTKMLVDMLREYIPLPFPHLVFDGSVNEIKANDSSIKICAPGLKNGDVMNLDANNEFENVNFDPEPFNCHHPKLQEVIPWF